MSLREKRAKRRRQRAREDILDVTRKLVLKHGLGGLTLTAIADELELTKAALYYYFDSKDALLFELIFGNMEAEVSAIESAVAAATTGAEAIEAIIRTVADHYSAKLDQFRLSYLAGQVGGSVQIKPEFLERIRPLNDRMYKRAAELIRSDQGAGIADADVDPRRAAFVAHCAVLGVLMMEGMIEASGDAPLIHGHDEMIDHLVAAHTANLRS